MYFSAYFWLTYHCSVHFESDGFRALDILLFPFLIISERYLSSLANTSDRKRDCCTFNFCVHQWGPCLPYVKPRLPRAKFLPLIQINSSSVYERSPSSQRNTFAMCPTALHWGRGIIYNHLLLLNNKQRIITDSTMAQTNQY